MTDEEINNLDLSSEQAKNLMREYEDTTDKYANWRGNITEGFMKWLKGEKMYDREKERISLYVADKTKEEWSDFIKTHKDKYNTISKLIRESVNYFIKQKSTLINEDLHKLDNQTLTNISHALKEPLTSIKGFSQLLIENSRDEMAENVFNTIQNIFNQSILLENKIVTILDNIKTDASQYDILLIEDDLATIRLLTSYFESKGFSCKGVVSGTKGLEELANNPSKLVLLDIILPDYSGYDICKQIKSNKELQNISVYLLTAIPGSEVEKHLEDSNADGYILKPFDFSDFEVIFQYL
ncbi:MAG: response regulator [Candidatus Lokiarchaeota archaeon]|nr:response regulator [Candidatus Lokiarchaeota archaeon]